MKKNPRMNSTSNHSAVKYCWFRQNVGKVFMIRNIDSDNQKSDTFTKGFQCGFLSGLGNFYAVGKYIYYR